MSDNKNSQVLRDIQGKIERERKLIQGFQHLKKITSNPEVVQRCNNQIRETQSNMDYLQETLMKVKLQDQRSEPSSPEKGDSGDPAHRVRYNRFDLIKYDCPSLGHKIQYMLQQLQFKLQVENQYKEANEKILQLYMQDGDKSSSSAARSGRLESDSRIQLLNKALKRYQDMHVDVEEVARDMELMNTPKYARKPLSGKLFIGITCVRDLDHIASPKYGKRPESIVSIRVDDVERARTKSSRNGRWNEEYEIDVDKGHEIELSVYDKSSNAWIPVAITWALLSDITEELRKKKVAQEMVNENWISAYALSNNIKGGDELSMNYNNKPPVLGNTSLVSNSTTLASAQSVNSDNERPKDVHINTWLSLEPVGQILVTISFSKSSQSNPRGFMGALGRHGAIRQKKEEVFKQHGHQFVQKQFYNIMCCALCGEFLRYTGYQCRDCKFLCHKKCFQKVVTKCIAKSSTEIDPDEAKLNHRIPHRFEPVTNRGTKWCCHCGYILPWGRKNVRKCSECGIMCHTYCTHLVPDFCGMSLEMANKILTTIKSARDASKPSQPKVLPLSNKVDALLPSKSPLTPEVSIGKTLDPMEEEQDKLFTSTLPTHNSKQFQETVEIPNKKTTRRPIPDLHKSLPEEPKEQDQGVTLPDQSVELSFNVSRAEIEEPPDMSYYTSEPSNVEEEEVKNPFMYPIEDTKNNFDNFDYEHPNNGYKPETAPAYTYKTIDVEEPVKEETKKSSPVKSRRRRRKVGLDDFQFLAVLGKGNFGKVMLAESRHTQQLCAIKVLKKDFIVENDEAESVKSEKRVFLIANKEKHPFLLNLHCCFQTENRIYFVMEYISGGDLMWHIQKSRFSAKRAKFYACEVLLALKYFHENGIIYRDLKLDNILLTTQGHVKIGDYGLCKENMWQLSRTNTFCGTPEFMAPEIVMGKEYDRSVDWWAFGVLLFQMLLCQSPFKGDDEDEIFNAVENDDVKYPISMPRLTVLVLQALLTKEPSKRLGSSERDALDIMEHPYFQDVNFDDVLNCRIKPPFLPEISSEHDFSNFDQEFTSETPRLTPVETVLTSEMQEQFRGFSHIAESATV